MDKQSKSLFQGLISYLILGIIIAIFVGLIVVFSYLLLWGILIGVFLWLAVKIKSLLFPTKTAVANKKEGIIIEHDKQP